MSLAEYCKYKESGIDWLGEIPEHWELKRNKDFCEIKGRIGFRGYTKEDFVNEGEGALVIGATEMNENGFLKITNPQFINWFKYFESPEIMLKPGYLLVVQRGSTVGKVVIVDESISVATINPSLVVLKKIRINERFLLFYLSSITIQCFIKSQTATTAIPMISQDQIGKYEVLVPPKVEQAAIANYLDSKTSAIDRKVALLEQKITHYQQLRKSLINETVCRGLNKNVKLKESGIEWIGEIPEHWEVKRLKDEYNLFTGNSISDKSLFEDKNNSLDYVSTKDIDVETGKIDYDNGVYIPKNDKSFKIAKANSILLCLEGANAGKKVGFNLKDICFVNKLCSIKGKTKNINEKYQFYCIQSPIFERQFFAILNGLIGGVSLNLVKFLNILLPPISEQTTIANYLDEKTQKIDSIVSNIKTQIETLKELRKTLINDVVTGKIKVTQ